MSRRIFKYELEALPRQMIKMHKGAQHLKIVVQSGMPQLYALVDENQELETRIFRLVTTGEEFNADNCVYIDTFVAEGWFVGHVFEQFEGDGDVVSKRFAQDFRDIDKELQQLKAVA
jgi:hypothetical protein